MGLKLIKLPQDIFDNFKKIEVWMDETRIVNNLDILLTKEKIFPLKNSYSLGIRHIGLENAKLLSKYLKSSKNLILLSKNKKFNDLLNIDGIGETQINSVKNFFSNKTNLQVLYELNTKLNIAEVTQIKKDGPLANKTLMFTGKLEGISRAEAKSLIEQNSGSIVSNVSKKLDFLIVGEKPTKRKIDAAKQLNIKILNQNELLKILNKTS